MTCDFTAFLRNIELLLFLISCINEVLWQTEMLLYVISLLVFVSWLRLELLRKLERFISLSLFVFYQVMIRHIPFSLLRFGINELLRLLLGLVRR